MNQEININDLPVIETKQEAASRNNEVIGLRAALEYKIKEVQSWRIAAYCIGVASLVIFGLEIFTIVYLALNY